MYLSTRGTLIRNIAAAVVNGAITLVLLLIAPLGLAAVITNTVLITLSTFIVCTGADLVISWLLNPFRDNGDYPRIRERQRRDDYPPQSGFIEPSKRKKDN
jgi:hypothetical protein